MSRDEVRGQEHLAARRAALLKVFRALASRWPKFFGPSRADELLPVWLRSTAGLDVQVLELAAIEFAANNGGKYAPDPHTFAQFARQWSDRVLGPASPAVDAEAQETGDLKNPSRIDALGHRAYKQLGSWRLVGEVWALLVQTAPSLDHRDAVRRGDVPWDVFDEAVESVQRGVRARPGPLSALAQIA